MSPPNKTQHIVSFLRESKISEFTNIMSNEEVVKELLDNSTQESSKELLSVPDSTKAIADVLQSITTEAMTSASAAAGATDGAAAGATACAPTSATAGIAATLSL